MSTSTLADPPSTRVGPAPRRRTWPAAAAVAVPVVLSAVLTAWRYGAKPLWRDEVYTLVTAGRPFAEVLELLAVRDAGLLGYYALMNPWLAVSESAGWMRLPSALATPVAVGLCALLARRVGGGPAALVAGVLVALAPSVVRHAQEARPYPLVLAAVSLTALLLLRAGDSPRRPERVALPGVAALAVALHPLVALPAVAALFAAVLVAPGRARRGALVVAGVPAGVVGLVLVAVGHLQAVERPPAPAAAWEYLTFWRIITGSPQLGLVVLALALAGAALLRRRREGLVLLAWAVAPVAAVTLLGLSGGYFNARYATAGVPALCVLAAVALTALHAPLLARAPRWAPWGVAAAVLAVVVVQAPAAVAHRAMPYYFDDAPSAAQELAASAVPGDAVVYAGPVARPLVTPHLPPERRRSGPPQDVLLVAGPDASATLGGQELPAEEQEAALAPYRRVWLVGTRATATNDLPRSSSGAEAAAAGRQLLSRHDHGFVQVELWAVPGS